MPGWEFADEDRLLAAAADDAGAFTAFYRRYERPMLAYFFRRTARKKLVSSLRRRVVADSARRRLRMAPIELEDGDIERIESEAGNVLELLEGLPAEQRDAVRARVIDERDYEEIAGELACSPAVVRKRVSRGLSRLREQLREERTGRGGCGVDRVCARTRGDAPPDGAGGPADVAHRPETADRVRRRRLAVRGRAIEGPVAAARSENGRGHLRRESSGDHRRRPARRRDGVGDHDLAIEDHSVAARLEVARKAVGGDVAGV